MSDIAVAEGRQRLDESGGIPRHHHAEAYAALVVRGEYEEAGDSGRWRVGAGDVLIHDPFESHCNRIGRGGAEVINFRLNRGAANFRAGRVRDPGAVLRLAARDATAAAALLVETAEPIEGLLGDWPDILADDLRRGAVSRLGRWALTQGLAPATLSRGFTRVYGTTPARYARKARVRRALGEIVDGKASLAAIALDCGFADQAHMTRSVVDATGAPPRDWRRAMAQRG